MAKGRTRCNICGSYFNGTDEDANIGLHKIIEYGIESKYEGLYIDLDICVDCFDKLNKKYSSKCAIRPIEDIED